MSVLAVIEAEPLVRAGLVGLLEGAGHEVVAAAASAAELPRRRAVALIVLGVGRVDEDTIAAVEATTTPVLAVADRLTDVELIDLLAAGARGVLLKRSVPPLLLQAATSVIAGGVFLDPHLVGRLVAIMTRGQPASGPHGLTTQERRVLALLPGEPTNRDIARQLGISVETVKTHLRNAMRKLGAYDRIDAARIVDEQGLGDL